MKCVVLNVNAYKMMDEKTGEIREGISLMISSEPTYTPNRKGFNIIKLSAPTDAIKIFDKVPAYYEIETDFQPGANMKANLKFKSAKYLKPLILDFA